MRLRPLFGWMILQAASCTTPTPKDGPSILWTIDEVSSVGGHVPVVLGAPKVVETERGKAVEFDGVDDGLDIPALVLAGAREFTLEVVFRPAPDGPPEQRFLHLQEDGSPSRFLIETRVLPGGKWYLDTYVETEVGSGTLVDAAKVHPTGAWYSAALSYDGRTMRHYVDGREELSCDLKFRPLTKGRTAIGMRLNRVYWFKGAIRLVRFTSRALPPAELLRP